MKKLMNIWILAGVISVTPVFAADEVTVTVACTDASEELRDAGYAVTVTSGGVTGATLATVLEQTLAGPTVLGTFAVKKNNRGMQRIYSASGFNLTIALESMVPTAFHSATFSLKQTSKKIKGALNCKIND